MSPHLLKHAEQHFPTEVAERGCLVGVDGELVWPNLDVILAEMLSIDYHLHHGVFLDIGHCIYHLEMWREKKDGSKLFSWDLLEDRLVSGRAIIYSMQA